MSNRVRLAYFLRKNRESITALIKEGDAESIDWREYTEVGRLLDPDLQLGVSFAQRVIYNSIMPKPPYPTLATAWTSNPDQHYGILHTHPNFPGNDTLSGSDIETLNRPGCFLMIAATQAGGRYQVIARWDEPDGTQQEERFDLNPTASGIAKFLARILNLSEVQKILADRNGDGILDIRDALYAARADR